MDIYTPINFSSGAKRQRGRRVRNRESGREEGKGKKWKERKTN